MAARASMPVSISAGSVMNEPPPASAFCAPAQSEARAKRTQNIMQGPDQAKSRAASRCFAINSPRSKSTGIAVDDAPAAGDHHAVGAVRAAEHERGERIVRAGKSRLVEREQREIRLHARREPADVVAPQAARGAFGRPAQHVEMRDRRGAVAQASDHQRVPHRLHHVGGIVGGRAVDAEPDRRAGRLQLAGRADARRRAPCWRPRNGRRRRPPARAGRSPPH